MMAQVYEGTGAVLVWLGPLSEDSHLAMGLLAEIRLNEFANDYILESVRKRDNFPRWKAVFALCHRDYWSRVGDYLRPTGGPCLRRRLHSIHKSC
jgi:hypothetical protein